MFVSGAIGAAASFVATLLALIFFHNFISARISFSKAVRCHFLEKRGRYSYSVKIRQRGYFDLIDVSVHCRLAIFDILKNGGSLWNFYSIPVTFERSLYWGSGTRIIHFNLHELKHLRNGSSSLLSQKIRKRLPEFGWRLEDVLMEFPEAYLRVHIIAHDKFSGTKKLYSSQKYFLFDLQSGHWAKNDIKLLMLS